MDKWKNQISEWSAKELYRFLAQRYILEQTKLDRIDRRMAAYEVPFIPASKEEREESREQDYMRLQYIYMENDVHMERLGEEQLQALEEARCHPDQEEAVAGAMRVVIDTYREVLAFSHTPDINVELYPSVSGEGIVPGNAVVFVFSVIPDYDGLGNVRDWKKEQIKENVLHSLKIQLEPICEKALQAPVRFMII